MDQGSPPATPGVGVGVGASSSSSSSKRRRLSQVDEGNILVESTRKRKRAVAGDPTYTPEEGGASPKPSIVAARSPEEFEQVKQNATILYDKLMQQRDPANHNRFLHEHFLELPDPQLIPEYYDKIKKPVCLNQIKQRLDSLAYPSLLDAKTDMNQIFVNAKRFNARESPLFMDAKKLHKNLRANYAYLCGEAPPPEEDEPPRRNRRGSSSVPAGGGGGGDDGDYVDNGGNASGGGGGGNNQKRGPTLKPWLLRKFDQLTRKTDQNGRVISDVFKVLPDKRAWPEYYQYITQPISLDNILAKVNQRKYRSVDQFKQDVETSFNNAMFFNEEFSQIWNDAKTMLDHFAEIMKEVPPKFAPPRKYNTARRRAEMENALAENNHNSYSEDAHDRAKSTQPDDDQQDLSQDESESGEESDYGGGDFSGFPSAVAAATAIGTGYDPTTAAATGGIPVDGFANPFASATSIPVLDTNYAGGGGGGAAAAAAATGQGFLQVQPPLDALTSLANLASSLSPQRPSLALPQPPQLQHQTSTSTSNPAMPSASFSPKPLAKIPLLGETPLVTSFIVSAVSSSSSSSSSTTRTRRITLENVQARQHSIVVPPLTNRIEIVANYRRERSDGSIVVGGGGEGDSIKVPVEISSTRSLGFSIASTTTTTTEQGGGGGGGMSPREFVLVPRNGLNVAEFKVVSTTVGNEDEVYRIFISK